MVINATLSNNPLSQFIWRIYYSLKSTETNLVNEKDLERTAFYLQNQYPNLLQKIFKEYMHSIKPAPCPCN